MVVLAVWTIQSPLRWDREVIDDYFGETLGMCNGEHWLAFAVPLIVIMISVTLLAGWLSWLTKDISDELSETKWIFYAIFTQFQVWLVGLPVLALVKLDISVNAAYLVSVLVIWTFSVSMVILIIGPRVVRTWSTNIPTHRSSRSVVSTSSKCFVSGLDRSGLGNGNTAPATSIDNNRSDGS